MMLDLIGISSRKGSWRRGIRDLFRCSDKSLGRVRDFRPARTGLYLPRSLESIEILAVEVLAGVTTRVSCLLRVLRALRGLDPRGDPPRICVVRGAERKARPVSRLPPSNPTAEKPLS